MTLFILIHFGKNNDKKENKMSLKSTATAYVLVDSIVSAQPKIFTEPIK